MAYRHRSFFCSHREENAVLLRAFGRSTTSIVVLFSYCATVLGERAYCGGDGGLPLGGTSGRTLVFVSKLQSSTFS